ncbi:MAG: type I CRISPR-associated protein Cas7 [Candidatus Micrarchaeota archaeon]
MTKENKMEIEHRKEFVFYYESRQNPNGDPGFENQPRVMPDGTILVTDVRVKRTIRDYAKTQKGQTLFVDCNDNGEVVGAGERATEIVEKSKMPEKGDIIKVLLNETFDAPLFGGLVTIKAGKKGSKKKAGTAPKEAESASDGASEEETGQEGDSAKLTGPVQFSLGRSTNRVQIINPSITSRFSGATKGETTIGKFFSVEYALIKFQGVVNPANLARYWSDNGVKDKFHEKEAMLFDCLWNGTNGLVSRSKFPQRSVFYVEVTYKDRKMYNDLPMRIQEDAAAKGKDLKELPKNPFKLDELVRVLGERKASVLKVRIAGCEELAKTVSELANQLKAKGIDAEEIKC